MGDFFLLQMDDDFGEGVCFDNRQGGGRGSVDLALPHSAKGKAKAAPGRMGRTARPNYLHCNGRSPVGPRPKPLLTPRPGPRKGSRLRAVLEANAQLVLLQDPQLLQLGGDQLQGVESPRKSQHDDLLARHVSRGVGVGERHQEAGLLAFQGEWELEGVPMNMVGKPR